MISWSVTYDDGKVVTNDMPGGWHAISRDLPFTFELFRNGHRMFGWYVRATDKLLYAKRSALTGGVVYQYVIVGIETMASTQVRLFKPDNSVELRERWAQPGEPDYVLWSRPTPAPGDR